MADYFWQGVQCERATFAKKKPGFCLTSSIGKGSGAEPENSIHMR